MTKEQQKKNESTMWHVDSKETDNQQTETENEQKMEVLRDILILQKQKMSKNGSMAGQCSSTETDNVSYLGKPTAQTLL